MIREINTLSTSDKSIHTVIEWCAENLRDDDKVVSITQVTDAIYIRELGKLSLETQVVVTLFCDNDRFYKLVDEWIENL